MKNLKKLKLNELRNANLDSHEMNELHGGQGGCCTCSCYYEGKGGSSSADNRDANKVSGGGNGTSSQNGCNQYMSCTYWEGSSGKTTA